MKRIFMLLLLGMLFLPGSASAEGKTVLLVAFGTSVESAKTSLDAIATAYTQRGDTVLWAYTSDIIRKKLSKEGNKVLSVSQAMNLAARNGVKELYIQSLHVTPAEEYGELQRMIVRKLARGKKHFDKVFLGYPLLVSCQDLTEVVKAALASLPAERTPEDAVIFMGHGNDRGPGDLVLYAANAAFQSADKNAHLATVEGSLGFDKLLPKLKDAGIKRVWLRPFMMVAGDHAHNDMAGKEADSWASQLKAAGMDVQIIMQGLGEIPAVRELFLRHTDTATDDLAHSRKQG